MGAWRDFPRHITDTVTHLQRVVEQYSCEGFLIRKIFVQGAKILFSGCLIAYLLNRIGIQTIIHQIGSMKIGWLVGALILFSMSHSLGSYQWCMLLRADGIQISWRRTLSFYFVGLFFNNFLVSNLGGDVFRMMDVRRYSRSASAAVSTVFLDRLAGLFVLTGMAFLTMPWMLLQSQIRTYLRIPLAFLTVGWVFVLLLLFNKRFVRPLAWLLKRFAPGAITTKVREVYIKIHNVSRKKRLLIRVIGISCLVQSARILMHYLIGRSLGITISPLYFFLFIPIIAIMAGLPISLGGIGIREQTGVLLFGLVGMTASQAFSVEFTAYLVAVASSLPGGIIFAGRQRVSSYGTEISDNDILKEQGHEVV